MADDVKIRIRAINEFKKTVSRAVSAMKRLGSAARTVGRQMRRVGIAAIAGLAAGVKHAYEFRVAMAEVSTMLDKSDMLIKTMSKDIIAMSAKFGMAKSVLAKGLYDILSAGVPAAKAMEFLRISTEAAVGGVTDTAVAVDALTTVINAYGMSADKVGHVSDIMFQIVRDGKVTYAELAENIAKIAPTAKVAGMSIENLGAVLATILKVEKPERAMTAIRATMMHAAKGGQDLFRLVSRFRGKTLTDIVGAGIGKRAAAGVAILANNFGLLQKEMERFQRVGGRAGEAFEKMDKVRHWPRIWRSFLSLVTRVGDIFDRSLAPYVDRIAEKFAEMSRSPIWEKWGTNLKSILADVEKIMDAILGGGKRRELALEGIKRFGTDFAKNAVGYLLRYAPIIGDAIGRAARQAAMGIGAGAGVRKAAMELAVRERQKGMGFFSRVGTEFKGALGFYGLGQMGGEISERSRQMRMLNLQAAGRQMAAGVAGGQLGWRALIDELEKLRGDVQKLKEKR